MKVRPVLGGAQRGVLVILAALLTCYWIARGAGESRALELANVWGPALLLAALWIAALRRIRSEPLSLWGPYPWFLLACGLYYGFGTLVNYFGNRASLAEANAYFPTTDDAILRTNILNAVGMLCVLLPNALFGRGRSERRRRPEWCIPKRRTSFWLWIFLVVGLGVKYLFIFPYVFGLTDVILPGSIMVLGGFTTAAVVVLVSEAIDGSAWMRLAAVLLVIAELTVSVATFSKLEVIIAMLAVCLGIYLRRPSVKAVGLGLAACLLVYVSLINAVMRGRSATSPGEGLETRLSGLPSVMFPGSSVPVFEGSQGWWTRLNLVQAQAFAMAQFDGGRRGETVELGLYALVPRTLWPGKPIMTPGAEFNYAMTGSTTSQSTPGIFGEAYWNGGWIAVVLVSLYVGFLMVWVDRIVRPHIEERNVGILPIAFLGIMWGLRPESWFGADYVGSVGIYTLMYLGFYFIASSGRRGASDSALGANKAQDFRAAG